MPYELKKNIKPSSSTQCPTYLLLRSFFSRKLLVIFFWSEQQLLAGNTAGSSLLPEALCECHFSSLHDLECFDEPLIVGLFSLSLSPADGESEC